MRKQTFIQGTIILLLAGIINRMLGFIPRIALPRIIGAEGWVCISSDTRFSLC